MGGGPVLNWGGGGVRTPAFSLNPASLVTLQHPLTCLGGEVKFVPTAQGVGNAVLCVLFHAAAFVGLHSNWPSPNTCLKWGKPPRPQAVTSVRRPARRPPRGKVEAPLASPPRPPRPSGPALRSPAGRSAQAASRWRPRTCGASRPSPPTAACWTACRPPCCGGWRRRRPGAWRSTPPSGGRAGGPLASIRRGVSTSRQQKNKPLIHVL